MIPGAVLSTEPVLGEILYPDNIPRRRAWYDWELGGIAIQDPSQGLRYQVWECFADNTDVYLKPENGAAFSIFEAAAVTELSFTFDQNMRWLCVYIEGGTCFFRWYDSLAGAYVVTDMGRSIVSPMMTHDDKRPTQIAASDAILTYIRGGALYFRAQRERFQIEHLLKTGLMEGVRIANFGMSNKLRLQWDIQ